MDLIFSFSGNKDRDSSLVRGIALYQDSTIKSTIFYYQYIS